MKTKVIFTLIHCDKEMLKMRRKREAKKSTAEKIKKEITLYELLSAIKNSKLAKKSTRRR